MLSTRLLHEIEAHADQLASAILCRFDANENLAGYQALSATVLHDRIREICEHLGEWLTEKTEDPLRQRYTALGRRRFVEGVPLDEVVLAFQITKDRILAFARSQGFSDTALELFGREELELRVSHFFDRAIYYIVRAYEEARRSQKKAS